VRRPVLISAYLTIKASGGGAIVCQWYSGTENSNSSGRAISGAVGSSYRVPTDSAGIVYYYCKVTDTLKKSSGIVSSSTVSDVAAVAVSPTPTISSQPEGTS